VFDVGVDWRRVVIVGLLVGCGRIGFEQTAIVVDGTTDSPKIGTVTGCADGTREGFIDRGRFPNIASCKAQWIGAISLRKPASGVACGNDLSVCVNPADACSRQWHLCNTPAEIAAVTEPSCNGTDAGVGRFAAAMSHSTSNVNGNCGVAQPSTLPCFDAFWGSEPVCCGTACFNDNQCRDGVFPGMTRITTSGGVDGPGCATMELQDAGGNLDGVICCRD
jgi:hypothetical protein